MILSKRNSLFGSWIAELKRESYLKINLILAGVVLLIIAYSGLFSPYRDNYPVACIHEKITGQQCASCGISHSFSLILRGKLSEAYDWNPYGLRVFLFFSGQLLMRLFFSVFYLKEIRNREKLIIYDIAGSSVIFLISFYPFIRQLVQSMLS